MTAPADLRAACCQICDRPGPVCPTLEVMVRSTMSGGEARSVAWAAMQDCRAHAVDWRATYKAVELLIEAVREAMAQREGRTDAVRALLAATVKEQG